MSLPVLTETFTADSFRKEEVQLLNGMYQWYTHTDSTFREMRDLVDISSPGDGKIAIDAALQVVLKTSFRGNSIISMGESLYLDYLAEVYPVRGMIAKLALYVTRFDSVGLSLRMKVSDFLDHRENAKLFREMLLDMLTNEKPSFNPAIVIPLEKDRSSLNPLAVTAKKCMEIVNTVQPGFFNL